MATKQQTPHRLTFPSSLLSLTRPSPSCTPSLSYGYQLQGQTLILGYTPLSSPDLLTDPPSDWLSYTNPVLSYLPIGVCIVGIHTYYTSPSLDKLLLTFQSLPPLIFPNNRLILSNISDNDVTHQLLDITTGQLSAVTTNYESLSSIYKLINDYVIKLDLKQEISCDITPSTFPHSFTTELDRITAHILSADNIFSVNTSKTKLLSIPLTPPDSKTKRTVTVKDLLQMKQSPYPLLVSLPPCPSTYTLSIHYHIWIPADLPNTQLDSTLRQGVVRYIQAIRDAVSIPCFMSICHVPHPFLPFLPLCLPNPHTNLINNSLIDPLSHSKLRHNLTNILLLSANTPYLYFHRVYPISSLHLCVPHLSITSSLPPSYTLVQTVSGLYDYYHYLTDGFDDCGWGCAYRSLQTIFSWFVLQGYVKGRDKPPSHQEAQEILVHLGDKTTFFVNSREWIGSVEIGLILQDMLSVKCKIIPLNSADELTDTARQLLYHFEKFGTPVMIGGGQLAHTILGVAYDESMGTCQFLVLDPHYRGPDDIKSVLKGGGCAWRGIKFWKPNTFYNLCLPIRDYID
ncbi:Ufm1-specific protease 2-like [Oopsacas minuta]|uniref:Ufm1-specific protease 2-like n=1 Tax=Oopsacas minuta TaxID=111878 RepID=A0AAV7JX12_9METZ|nr:Ufm1-specific protease 2-like [Oopsacas minuta]